MTDSSGERIDIVIEPEAQFSTPEVEQFQREGFLIARGLVPAEVIATMRDVTFDGLKRHIPPIEYEADLKYPGAPQSLDSEGGKTARRLKMALARHPVFLEFLSQPAVVQRLQQLLGPRVVCPLAHHNCIMTKQPAYSSDTGWHQDIRYWSFQKPELVNLWIALGDERPDNGGLWVIPGSHRWTYLPEMFDAEKFFRTDLPENAERLTGARPVELRAGDVLLFHCLTLHAASRNQTTEPKLSAVFSFRGGENGPRPGTRSAASPELVLTPGI